MTDTTSAHAPSPSNSEGDITTSKHQSASSPTTRKRKLVTSALPYVNNVPHLGNIIGSVLSADVFARYCRARGFETLYICGTDEYGTTTATRALAEGCTPQELCDKYYAVHKAVYDWFDIKFDIFGRTTTKLQSTITQEIFLKLHKNNFLKEEVTTQLYCQQHEAFLADRFVEGECPHCGFNDARGDQCDSCGRLLDPLELKNPRCKLDGAAPSAKETKHIFLELDKLQPEIEEWFKKSSTKGAWSSNGRDITTAWFKEGLKPRSITRDMKWGVEVPLPGYQDKVIYSWFDACIGYVSITACHTGDWQRWWRHPEDVELYQFLGKDNVTFHTVIFPGSQLGTRDSWTMLHHLSTTEYLTYEGGKFSKSRGIGVFGDSAQKTGVPADVWRYYLLSKRPETSDSEFEWSAFISANNNVLLKNLGNFVSRVVKFVNSKNYNNIVPDYTQFQDLMAETWKIEIDQLLTQYIEELDAVKLRSGLATVFHISQKGNNFLQSNALDNKLAEQEPVKCAAVIGLALNLIHLLSSLISPYMPETATAILKQLRAEPLEIPDNHWTADSIKPGHEIGKAAYLFTQIKPEKEEEWRNMFGDDEARKAKEEEQAKKDKKKAAMKAAKALKKKDAAAAAAAVVASSAPET